MRDTTILEEQIKALTIEQEAIQHTIILDTHKIEIINQTMKFKNKRLKTIEKELVFWQTELNKLTNE